MYEDKTLVCKECGKEFVFTAGEQEFYAERGFQNEPQRWRKACRDVRKNAARGPRSSSPPPAAPAAAGCPRALRAQERPSCLLRRLLRQDARERLIADSVDCKSGCPPRWTPLFSSRVSALPHIVIGRAQGAAGGVDISAFPEAVVLNGGLHGAVIRGCPPAHSRKSPVQKLKQARDTRGPCRLRPGGGWCRRAGPRATVRSASI